MILVIDASVALKWFFRGREDDTDTEQALGILAGIDQGRFEMLQPPHFLAEVAAVLAREKADTEHGDLIDLHCIESRVCEDAAVYAHAVELGIRLKQHLFDARYHATALATTGATLVTADRRYFGKAKSLGKISLLSEFRPAA